jgi:MoaA/NifB/PqqE/SkfB family radical SAM enzyme
MSKTLRRYSKKTSKIYSEKGFRGLSAVAAEKLKSYALPTAYKNNLLNRLVYPKMKVAFLEVTSKCNLRCKMCIYKKMQDQTGHMSKQLFENCVDQLSKIGVDSLCLHFGGESLVHPDFKEYLKYAVDHRDHGKIKKISWNDNGMLFDQSISDLVVDLKVDSITFSLDGVGEVNDSIRLGSNYSLIEKNIKYLINRRGAAPKPEVHLGMCEYGKTEEQKMDVYRAWSHIVDGINLIPSIMPDNTWEHKKNSSILKTIDPPPFCISPFETMAIGWDGRVTGCCLDYVFNLDLGDATKMPIKDIWRGSKFRDLRRAAILNAFSVGSPCHGCEFWQINFNPREESILDGKALMEYGYIYRKIKKNPNYKG